MGESDAAFWLPRSCFCEPIPEIAEAQALLDAAANAHHTGDATRAAALIAAADIPAVHEWIEPIWSQRDASILRFRKVPNAPAILALDQRPKPRAPDTTLKYRLIARDGYHCRFCGIPVIDASIRDRLRKAYPQALRWGRKSREQHAAFQCMWLQFDHLLPNSRGGDTTLENMVVTCAACNFGRMEYTLDEVGLVTPLPATRSLSSWDGLTRLRAPVQVVDQPANPNTQQVPSTGSA
jgi:5-methylcytosine-specific restriction endonuclease McrA